MSAARKSDGLADVPSLAEADYWTPRLPPLLELLSDGALAATDLHARAREAGVTNWRNVLAYAEVRGLVRHQRGQWARVA